MALLAQWRSGDLERCLEGSVALNLAPEMAQLARLEKAPEAERPALHRKPGRALLAQGRSRDVERWWTVDAMRQDGQVEEDRVLCSENET